MKPGKLSTVFVLEAVLHLSSRTVFGHERLGIRTAQARSGIAENAVTFLHQLFPTGDHLKQYPEAGKKGEIVQNITTPEL